jgi:hypothetical protein
MSTRYSVLVTLQQSLVAAMSADAETAIRDRGKARNAISSTTGHRADACDTGTTAVRRPL